eukprot:12946374-Alexandrium_andersonii.AAC.1
MPACMRGCMRVRYPARSGSGYPDENPSSDSVGRAPMPPKRKQPPREDEAARMRAQREQRAAVQLAAAAAGSQPLAA